jgi:hypothetical protein
MPSAIEVSTLTGLIDYLNNKTEEHLYADRDLIIHIVDHKTVAFKVGSDSEGRRSTMVLCKAQVPGITFDRYVDSENFNVMLQSCFIKNDDLETVLRVVGNIKEENVKNTGDNGISQQVVARKGVAQLENVIVPNPVTLKPFRTFIEIDQPSCKFVLRMKDGPECALFEADAGAWKLDAMQTIKTYLAEKINNKDVKILA